MTGDFDVTDVDNGEEEGDGGSRGPTYAILTGALGTNQATVSGGLGRYTVTKGGTTWGTITLNVNTGEWTFTANAAQINTLADGESEILALTARVRDAGGTIVTKAFTITLHGADEVEPLVLDTASSDVTGNAYKGDSGVADTGQLTLDESGGPSPTGTLDYGGTNGVYTGTYGTLTIDTTGKWHYALTSDDAALDTAGPGASFDDGETLTETFTVTITDGGTGGSGGTVEQVITITIGGRDEGARRRVHDARQAASLMSPALAMMKSSRVALNAIPSPQAAAMILSSAAMAMMPSRWGQGLKRLSIAMRVPALHEADDGGDTINDFELGVDKLLLVDMDGTPLPVLRVC